MEDAFIVVIANLVSENVARKRTEFKLKTVS